MNPITAGIVGSGLLLFLLFLGMPIAFVMMFVGFLGISCLASVNATLPVVAKTVYETPQPIIHIRSSLCLSLWEGLPEMLG